MFGKYVAIPAKNVHLLTEGLCLNILVLSFCVVVFQQAEFFKVGIGASFRTHGNNVTSLARQFLLK